MTDTDRPENDSPALSAAGSAGGTEGRTEGRSTEEHAAEAAGGVRTTDTGALRSRGSSSAYPSTGSPSTDAVGTGRTSTDEPVAAAAAAEPSGEDGREVGDAHASAEAHVDDTDGAQAVPPHYGIGPFSVREITLGIVWLFAFVVSFFPLVGDRSVWTNGLEWILTIGLPTAAVFLIALRRLSPTGIRRVGSLGIDQFASVAFSVSTLLWLQYIWETVAVAISDGTWIRSWVMWVEAVLMIAGVVLTVAARWLPVLGDDFQHREPVVAQPSARPIRPVTARPVVARPPRVKKERVQHDLPVEAILPIADQTPEPAPETTQVETTQVETARNDAETVAVPVAHQAFWALSPVERDVVDEHGVPLFRIGPTAWALVIEDRGSTFVVRNDDGRIGYLRDVSGVTRG